MSGVTPCWVLALLLALVAVHQFDAEAAPVGGDEFFSFDDASGLEEADGAALFLQLETEARQDGNGTNTTGLSDPNAGDSNASDANVTNVTETPVNFSAMATGSGSGIGSGSAAVWDPKPLNMPYEEHMDKNLANWSHQGGWNKGKEDEAQAARDQLKVAQMYADKKKAEKEASEMGCPCEGEKYYELVWGGPAELSSLVAGFGSAAGSAGGSADFNSLKDKNKTDDDDGKVSPATIKKMIKKYGKLGPNSTWKPKHDRKKKRAAVALKLAEKVEDVAFKTALPEFRQMREDDPAFFANGDCPCPPEWTKEDAAALSAKESKDTEDAYWKDLKAHRHQMNELSGANERLEKQEAAGEPSDDQMPRRGF